MSLGNIDLNPQLVQAVRDTIDIVSIASEHTRLSKAGHRYKGLCPLHKEKTPSFSVDPSKGLFYCFGCGAGGDAIRLHMLTSGDDFPAAIESLAQKYGIPLPSRRARSSEGPREPDLRPALEAAEEFFRDQLKRSPFARRYLEERQMPAELAEEFGLGYAPDDWRQLLEALSRRIPTKDLEAAGLITTSDRSDRPYDRFRNRLIFPIRNPSGRLVGFGGRTLGEDRAKYINTSETAQFHKSRLLYGLSEGKREMRDRGVAVLTEGYFDVLGTVASGFPGAVASMGTSLTAEQSKLLARFCDQVIIAYDGDDAGEAAARRALPLLLGVGLTVRRARLAAGHDPDSLRLEEGPEAVREALESAPDAVHLELDRLVPQGQRFSPQERAEAAEEVRQLLSPIPDPIVRLGYGRIAAQRLEIPEELLWRGQRNRRRGGPEGPAGPDNEDPGESRRQERLTRSHEEWVLAVLLSDPGGVPEEELLPPEAAFLDGRCRRLFKAYREAYRDTGAAPDADRLRRALPVAGAELEHLAWILGDGTDTSRFRLPEMLAQLRERHDRQQLQQLAVGIRQADERGEVEEVLRLVELKQEISRRLHKGSRGGPRSA
ncbi:MAG: DNA primase [Acidobacteriota bacterium]|nr:DNA primase [Acidobacteriota bacterium]